MTLVDVWIYVSVSVEYRAVAPLYQAIMSTGRVCLLSSEGAQALWFTMAAAMRSSGLVSVVTESNDRISVKNIIVG